MTQQAKVVFVATPTIGNLVPVVEFSKLLSQKNQNLSVTVLLINFPQRPLIQSYIDSLADDGNLEFLSLPAAEPPSTDRANISFLSLWIENHGPHVRRALTKLKSDDDVRMAGFFIDMFCTSFIDVAEELDIPCYLYFASPASFLSFMLHMPTLDAQVRDIEFRDAAKEYVIPGFENPVPVESFPHFMSKRHEDTYLPFLQHAKRYRETRGMVVNTFQELESYCLGSMFAGNNDVGPDGVTLVSAEAVERGVRKLMDGDDEVRGKVKEYSEMCKRVWMKNGSSAVSLGKLIEDLNI
nr:anthocyanidin 3-O-glucosyltransferase 2-like [Ipomoea trifida]